MCLTVFSNAEGKASSGLDDPNAGARLSLLGQAHKLTGEQSLEYAERFFTLYPDSRKYQGTHDFMFYKLKCERVRFIGGFGNIHWISEDEWQLQTPEWLGTENSMIEHMNEDHMDAMKLICAHRLDLHALNVEMLALNPDGFFMSADESKPVYVPFDKLAYTGVEVRQQLVKLTNDARAAASSYEVTKPAEQQQAVAR